MEFYKIINPTTAQIFNAIINNDYVPIESIQPKAKQIYILLREHFISEPLVTFENVTNTGGVPIFLGENESLHEVAAEVIDNFYELSEDEQEQEIELLGCYLRTFKAIFNI